MNNEQEIKNFSEAIVNALQVKGLSMEKLSQLTGISEHSLQALVEEKFSSLPSAPYVHGYLLKIAEVLNLNGEKLWADYLKDNETLKRSGSKDRLPQNRFAIPKLNRKIIWLGIIAVILIAYGIFRLPSLFGKPEIILNITDKMVVKEAIYKIKGSVNSQDQLTINGEQVYPDLTGQFEKNIELQLGFNTFVFKVKKLLGRETAVTRQIFYETVTSTLNNGN